jgi:hypothetical protein
MVPIDKWKELGSAVRVFRCRNESWGREREGQTADETRSKECSSERRSGCYAREWIFPASRVLVGEAL